MIKSILVPISGSETDEVVRATTLAAAWPFGAHRECWHISVDPADAAFRTLAPDLVMGSRVRGELKQELLHGAQALAGSSRLCAADAPHPRLSRWPTP